jgi:hypothetical protein
LPEDAVRIAALRHAELMTAQSEGARSSPTRAGGPCWPGPGAGARGTRAGDLARSMPRPNAASLVASLARQSNDNALIAQAALAQASGRPAPEGLAEALARRAAILRAIATRIAAQIATMPAANLTGRYAAARLWGGLTWPKSRNSRSSPNPMAARPSWCSRMAWPSACRARR